MSRAFVKDAEYLEELPERPVSQHPNDVTEAGLAQIEHALAAASEAYANAQASADRAALGAAGRDLRYWTARRATARVVPAPTDRSEVRFGALVTIVRDDGREQPATHFYMVGMRRLIFYRPGNPSVCFHAPASLLGGCMKTARHQYNQ